MNERKQMLEREKKRVSETVHWEMGRQAETLISWLQNGI